MSTKNWNAGAWLFVCALFAFPGTILLFNTNSYWADTHHANTLVLVADIVLCVIAILFGLKAANKGGTPPAR
jgi:ABC-type proline/glycine betaine transport system permease subunit